MIEPMLKVRNLVAIDADGDFAGHNRKLTVDGEIEVKTTNGVPNVTEAQPPGISPVTLILDVVVSTSGVGGDALTWKAFHFDKPIENQEYRDIDLHVEHQSIGKVAVERRHS